MSKKRNPEQEIFNILCHSLPINTIKKSDFFIPKDNHLYPLFNYSYKISKKLYKQIPLRKNGENSFLHPINILYALKKARIEDELTYCIGILHDYIEEIVDIYKKENNLKEDKKGIKILDRYELEVAKRLNEDLVNCCKENDLSLENALIVMGAIRLLTRHKRHFYYKSISDIYNCKDERFLERAIQIKLADRTHNILSIDCYPEEGKLYQCFKNLFIMNNGKKFLLNKYGTDVFSNKLYSPTEKLFNKCAKATYDAFLKVCASSNMKELIEVKYILQLAFKKFELAKLGIFTVTDIDEQELHPMKLFQGVIWKYDARLHHEFEKFEKIKRSETGYCKRLFSKFNFNKEQIQAVLEYKDAFALKEVVAYLIYHPSYYISGFLSSELSHSGRIAKKKGRKLKI